MKPTLLSNHGRLLLYVDAHPDARLREAAAQLGVTERTTHKIISELTEAGYVSSERIGRRKRYTVLREAPLRDAQLVGHTLGQLLNGLDPSRGACSRDRDRRVAFPWLPNRTGHILTIR